MLDWIAWGAAGFVGTVLVVLAVGAGLRRSRELTWGPDRQDLCSFLDSRPSVRCPICRVRHETWRAQLEHMADCNRHQGPRT
jgi:hypothetical protein